MMTKDAVTDWFKKLVTEYVEGVKKLVKRYDKYLNCMVIM